MSKNFKKLQKIHPFPKVNFDWKFMPQSYTGRGKDIIVKEIYQQGYTDLLEVGCFLGGSIDFWLNACFPLNIVAVDCFRGGWAGKFCEKSMYHQRSLLTMLPEDIECLNSEDGLYRTFLRNISWRTEHRERVLVIRQNIQEAIPILHNAGYEPDIIFLDADKRYETLEVVFHGFKNSLLAGDDYVYKDTEGKYPMQENLRILCNTYDLRLEHRLGTWIVYK